MKDVIIKQNTTCWTVTAKQRTLTPQRRICKKSCHFPKKKKRRLEMSALLKLTTVRKMSHFSKSAVFLNVTKNRSHKGPLQGERCRLCLLSYFRPDVMDYWPAFCSKYSENAHHTALFCSHLFHPCSSREGQHCEISLIYKRRARQVCLCPPPPTTHLWLKYNPAWSVKCGMAIQIFLI